MPMDVFKHERNEMKVTEYERKHTLYYNNALVHKNNPVDMKILT